MGILERKTFMVIFTWIPATAAEKGERACILHREVKMMANGIFLSAHVMMHGGKAGVQFLKGLSE